MGLDFQIRKTPEKDKRDHYADSQPAKHTSLHELFEQGILNYCWCSCKYCFHKGRAMCICRTCPDRRDPF